MYPQFLQQNDSYTLSLYKYLPTVLKENNNHSVSHYYVFRHKLVHF